MFEGLDAERASSVAFLFAVVALVGGLLLEYASVDPDASRAGASVAGLIVVLYAAGATVYLLTNEDSGEQE